MSRQSLTGPLRPLVGPFSRAVLRVSGSDARSRGSRPGAARRRSEGRGNRRQASPRRRRARLGRARRTGGHPGADLALPRARCIVGRAGALGSHAAHRTSAWRVLSRLLAPAPAPPCCLSGSGAEDRDADSALSPERRERCRVLARSALPRNRVASGNVSHGAATSSSTTTELRETGSRGMSTWTCIR